MSTLEQAISLAADLHEGQRDKSGDPYILHPLRVMMAMRTEKERITAILHDVLEDTTEKRAVAEAAIRGLFGHDVFSAVELLTRDAEMTYREYIEELAHNPLSRSVKIADINDNLSPERASGLTDSHRQRYEWARTYLILKQQQASGWPVLPEGDAGVD